MAKFNFSKLEFYLIFKKELEKLTSYVKKNMVKRHEASIEFLRRWMIFSFDIKMNELWEFRVLWLLQWFKDLQDGCISVTMPLT